MLLLSLTLTSAKIENIKDAQRRILIFILDDQNRLFTIVNNVLLIVSLLLINFTNLES